jgi:hypothetical protein
VGGRVGPTYPAVMTASPTEPTPLEDPLNRDDDLDDSSWHVKHVYALYGLASYHAQTLERGLMMAVTLRTVMDKEAATVETYDSVLSSTSRRTMGQVLKSLKPHLNNDSSLLEALDDGLLLRNHLAHSFWWDNAARFEMIDGREGMVSELMTADRTFQDLDSRLHEVVRRYTRDVGVSEDEQDKRVAEAMPELRAAELAAQTGNARS